MKSIKYIFILFISMYISSCLAPAAEVILGWQDRTEIVYVILIPFIYFLLVLCEYMLNIICNKWGTGNLIEISQRPPREEKYIFGLDLVRFFAIISVPAVHFIGLTGFYSTPLEGKKMFFATCLRGLFICCVPLFLTLTGYLKSNKGINIKHYIGILPLLATHIFITSVRLFIDYKYHKIDIDLDYITDKLIYFEYGWYIQLYIGLMLLLPFVNYIWKSIEKREHKELLIITLIFLCSMGPLTFSVVPATWVILYVFIYYFIGAYLSEYKVRINKLLNLCLILGMLLLGAVGGFLNKGDNSVFNWDFAAYSYNSGYSSLPVVVLTLLIMIFLADINTKYGFVKKLFHSFSVVSLEMYMFSQMFDGIIYPKFSEYSFKEMLTYMPAVVGVIVVLSYIVSHIKRFIFWSCKKVVLYLNK